MTERALVAVIHRAPGGRAIQLRSSRGQETSARRHGSAASRPGGSTTASRPLRGLLALSLPGIG
jgi:hypothetical protein